MQSGGGPYVEQARIRGEYTGGGGSGSVGFALVDQNLLREQFVINLERFGKGNLPKATAADRERAARELSAAYEAVKAMPAPDPNEVRVSAASPTPEGFSATEQPGGISFKCGGGLSPQPIQNYREMLQRQSCCGSGFINSSALRAKK